MKIAIVGTGLIGTSLGLALKTAKVKATIVGTDRNFEAASKAQKRGALDKVERRLLSAVEGAELVILATPVMAMKDVLEFIGPELAEGSVVTDTGSSKASVLGWAEQHLPPSVHFVGGHPIAGKDASGPDEADADLFKGCIYCLVPSRRASEKAVSTVVQMVEWIGAKPFFLNVEEHDTYAAAVSHLPVVLSAALMKCASDSPSWPDIARVAASAYRGLTSLASTSSDTNRDMCATNAKDIAQWIDRLVIELSQLRDRLVSEGDSTECLNSLFSSAWEARARWLSGSIWVRPGTGMERHSFGDQVGEMMMGRKALEAFKRVTRSPEKKEQK